MVARGLGPPGRVGDRRPPRRTLRRHRGLVLGARRHRALGRHVTVIDVVGDSPLQPGDVVRSIDGRPVDDWVAGEASTQRARRRDGDLRDPAPGPRPGPRPRRARSPSPATRSRPSAGTRPPWSGSAWSCWRAASCSGADPTACRSGRSSRRRLLLPAWLTAIRARARGHRPGRLARHLAAVRAEGSCAHSAWGCRRRRDDAGPPGRRPPGPGPPVLLAFAALPLVGYAVWLLGPARALTTEAARLQAQVTVVPPALVVALPAVVALLCWRYARSDDRATTAGDPPGAHRDPGWRGGPAAARRPAAAAHRRPAAPVDVLVLLITPAVLACLAVAVDGYRLDEVEPTVRRAVVQALAGRLVATLVRRRRRGGRPGLRHRVRVDARRRRPRPARAAAGRRPAARCSGASSTATGSSRTGSSPTCVDSRPRSAPEDALDGDAVAAGATAPALLRGDRRPAAGRYRRRRGGDRREPGRTPSPSTWSSAAPTSVGCCSRWRRSATRSGRATDGCSRTWASRSARSCRRCWPTASSSAPGSAWSPPARRSGGGSGATSTTGSGPRSPRWPCGSESVSDLIERDPAGGGRAGGRARRSRPGTRSSRYAGSSTGCDRPPSTSSAWSPRCGSAPRSTAFRARPVAG